VDGFGATEGQHCNEDYQSQAPPNHYRSMSVFEGYQLIATAHDAFALGLNGIAKDAVSES
jgi:hypothetical protein